MKDRMTLGHVADVAETAALTLSDERAERRMFDAMDWAHDELEAAKEELRRKERNRKRRNRALAEVRKALGEDHAKVFAAWLKGQTWRDIGVPERTFRDRQKNLKEFFGLVNIG